MKIRGNFEIASQKSIGSAKPRGPCRACKGLGQVYGFDGRRPFWETCSRCWGKGRS